MEFLTNKIVVALSANRETTFNTKPAGSFNRFVTDSKNFFVPTIEKFDDAGKIGLGQEFATKQSVGYLNPVTMEISDDFDSFIHAIIMLRACGDTDTVAALAAADAGAHSHTFKIMPSISYLPSFSTVWALGNEAGGGADYIWTGCVVDSFGVQQARSEAPKFTASIISSGRNEVNTSSVVYANKDQELFIGAETEIYYGSTPTYLATRVSGSEKQRITNWSLNLNNNNRTDDRRPGDMRLTSSNPSGGHYVNRIPIGEQRELTAQCSIVMDDAMTEVAASISNSYVTDFTIETRGKIIVNGGTQQYAVKFQFPKAYLNVTAGSDDAGTAVLTTDIKPVFDTATSSILDITVYNDVATPLT